MTTRTAADALPKKSLTIFLCFLVALLEGYDLQVLAVSAPMMRREMGLSPQDLGLALSAGLVGLAIGALIGGGLADRIGRKWVMIGSVVGMGVFTLATAFVHDLNGLLLARVLTGLAIGGAMPNMIATVAAVSDERNKTTNVAMMICGMPAGGIIAALAGHAVIPAYGWHGLYVLGGALTILIAPLLIWGLRDTVVRKTHGTAPISYGAALFGDGRAPATVLLWALFIVTLLILSLILGWAPSLVISKGLPPSAGFSVLLALNGGGILGTLIVGRLCDTWGVRNALVPVYLGIAISVGLFAMGTSAGSLIPLAALMGFCVLGAQFAMYGVAPRLYPPSSYGTGVGAAVAAGRIGSISGPIIGGALIGAGATGSQVILAMAPVALLGAIILILLVGQSRGALVSRSKMS